MFDTILRRAQVTVDNAIDQAVNRIIVTIPFLVAGGFATAALTTRLTRMLGDEMGYLAVAGVFSVIGLIVAAVVSMPRSAQHAEAVAEPAAPLAEADPHAAADAHKKGAAIDKELMSSAVHAMAPFAVPALVPLLRALGRNLPLIATVLAAAFVMTRTPSEEPATSNAPAQA